MTKAILGIVLNELQSTIKFMVCNWLENMLIMLRTVTNVEVLHNMWM